MWVWRRFWCAFLMLNIANYAKAIASQTVRSEDICGAYNGRRVYLEHGGAGVLVAKNTSGLDTQFGGSSQQHQCSLELITCPSCVISVKFTFLNISRNCGKNSVLDSCGCDYVWIYEPPYEDVSGEQFCGHFVNSTPALLRYKSQTRATAINFLFSSLHVHAFTLEYSAERNRQYFDGYPNKYNVINKTNQVVTSPFFSHYYPRDLNTEYVITCTAPVESCRVRLIFTDFQLSPSSLIEFFDYNLQRIHVITGSAFRPPLITTTGPKMVIRFYANGGTNLGFKAIYTFLAGETNSTLKPDTDCGGYVDNLGGAITMMNMLKDTAKAYDCFWIVRPPDNYLHLKTQIYIKITTFADFAGPTELTIRQGVTSNEPIVEALRHPNAAYALYKQREHSVPIARGFYVSLKGLFRPESRLAIAYAAFNYKACFSGSDYLCRNMRCIPAYLVCDGFDHCGDNSDETTTCTTERTNDRLRWSHTPNYFFPKNDKYSYLKTATIVFVVCSLGLMTLIFALVLILYRLNVRNRNHRHLQTHLQSINDMLGEGSGGSVIEEILIPDEPPLYEAPPDYESVLKVTAATVDKRRSRSRSRSKSRSANKCAEATPLTTATLSSPMEAEESNGLLPPIETTDCEQSKPVIVYNVFAVMKRVKHPSLEDLRQDRGRQLSLDAKTVKLYNKSANTDANRSQKSILMQKRQQGNVSLSETQLLHSCQRSRQLSLKLINLDSRFLRRSVSIENLFTTV